MMLKESGLRKQLNGVQNKNKCFGRVVEALFLSESAMISEY